MSPRAPSIMGKILRVSARPDIQASALRLRQQKGNPIALRVLNCSFLGFKGQANLSLRIAGTCPPHQRIKRPRRRRTVFQDPTLRIGRARLHRASRRTVNSSLHCVEPQFQTQFACIPIISPGTGIESRVLRFGIVRFAQRREEGGSLPLTTAAGNDQ